MSYLSMRFSFMLLGILFVVASACEDQLLDGSASLPLMNFNMTQADTSSIDRETLEKYRTDAGTLAVQYVKKRDSTVIRIPDKIVNTFYSGLLHIHNSPSEDARLVTRTYSIRPRSFGAAYDLSFSFDSSASWGKAWAEGKRLSGNEAIDELITAYNLQLEKVFKYESLGKSVARFSSHKPLNMEALARLFEKQTEIQDADASSFLVGGSPDLQADVNPRSLEFTFSLGWGDCPAGCIYHHFWRFHVFRDGRVLLADEYGDPLSEYR